MAEAERAAPVESLDLEAIRKRCEAASPGPWTYRVEHRPWSEFAHYQIQTAEPHPAHPWSPRFLAWMNGGREIAKNVWRDLPDHKRALLVDHGVREERHVEPDAIFIADARSDVPLLIAEVERLRAEVERLRTLTAGRRIEGWARPHHALQVGAREAYVVEADAAYRYIDSRRAVLILLDERHTGGE